MVRQRRRLQRRHGLRRGAGRRASSSGCSGRPRSSATARRSTSRPPGSGSRCATRSCEETGVDIVEASRDELAELAGDDAEPDDDWAGLVDTLQGKLVEPKLIQPTFIVDLPLDIWPLVKPDPEHPELLGEAFDGIVAGMEIVGGGTDINDPIEQRRRFVDSANARRPGAEEDPHPHDEEFVRALEYGMLPASGCGLGVDRLMMILTGVEDPPRRDPLPLDARERPEAELIRRPSAAGRRRSG